MIDRERTSDMHQILGLAGRFKVALHRILNNLMQPGRTFGFDAATRQYVGLLRDRPVQFILTRYSTASDNEQDFQLPYLLHVFRSMGVQDIRVVSACATTQPSVQERQAYVVSFFLQLENAAGTF